jgi:hypothetical protein
MEKHIPNYFSNNLKEIFTGSSKIFQEIKNGRGASQI